MEDLIYLLLIVAAATIALALAATAFVVAATIATICVFGAAIHAFAVTMFALDRPSRRRGRGVRP